MRKYAFIATLVGLVTLPLVTLAQGSPPSSVDLSALLPQLFSAVAQHHWLVVLGLGLTTILAVAASHKAGISKAVPWFATDAGGTVWTFLVAALGALATTFAAGQSPGLVTVQAAIGIGVVAIGGYTGLRKLLSKSGGLGAKFPQVAAFVDAFGPQQQAPQSSSASPAPAALLLLLAGSLLFPGSARADVTVSPQTASDVVQLGADGKTAVSQVKSGSSIDSATASKVNADVSQVAADVGAAAKPVTVKGHVVNLTVGGGALANIAFPSKSGGVSIAGGGGVGILVGAAFGSNVDGSDHYHVNLSLGVNTLTFTLDGIDGGPSNTVTEPAFVAAILPSYQPAKNAPLYGLGPVMEVPLSGKIRGVVWGFTFSTGFDFIAHQFNSTGGAS